MSQNITFAKWEMTEAQVAELGDLSPTMVRDLLVVCFTNAQKENFSRNPGLVSGNPTDDHVTEMMMAMLNEVARTVGGSMDSPDKGSLQKIVEELAHRAMMWGTPRDIINHHQEIMTRLISRIPA